VSRSEGSMALIIADLLNIDFYTKACYYINKLRDGCL
jgi:hypothetical protein